MAKQGDSPASLTHSDLTMIAEKWLSNTVGCSVAFRDLKTSNKTGEIPDAIGWRDGVSIMIEAKTSRSDFLADKKKVFRVMPELGVGDWRFFLCPPNMINPDELPEGWGLLYATGNIVKRVHGVPKGNCEWGNHPFVGNKNSETIMLVSALRRLKLRGHLHLIYEPFEGEIK